MKAKHIITTCGVILGGLAVAQSASAVVTYQGSSEVQFTFAPKLTLSLSENGFTISKLVPGTFATSNAVDVSVDSNSSSGYILSATVGNATYDSTDLLPSTGGTSKFSMIGSSATKLAKGTWGYTLDDGDTYGAIVKYGTTASSQIVSSDASSGTTSVKIGAYATDDQSPTTYNNVVNFAVISNVAMHTITIANNGANVASVSLNGDAANIGSFDEGNTISISATCASGYTFSSWSKNYDYGTIADPSAATTTYTVGIGDVTLTPACS